MPNLRTNRHSMLKQQCKDCSYLVIQPDGEHVDCDPPMGECPADCPATISLKPTPTGYANSLILILENSESPADKAWARTEIIKSFKAVASLNPGAWGKEIT